MFRWCVDPRRHLILLIICRRKLQIISLVASKIEQEVHGEERVEGRGVLDGMDILF